MALDSGSGRPEHRRTPLRTWPALTIAGVDFSQPDDLVQVALLDFDVAAIEEMADGSCVYFTSPASRDAAAAHLHSTFPNLSLTPLDVPDEDWAARSQASLRAVQVGNMIVAPPWDAGWQKPAVTSLIIQPSMGFGTGHHATTRLCLAALQVIPLRGRTLIDVGTGSGILAIAASLLGAGGVIGIDDDPDAIRAADENVTLNPSARVSLHAGDFRTATLAAADVVTANLTGALLAGAAPRLLQLTRPGGCLVMSGFMGHEEGEVIRAFAGCHQERRAQEDEWVCTTFSRAALL